MTVNEFSKEMLNRLKHPLACEVDEIVYLNIKLKDTEFEDNFDPIKYIIDYTRKQCIFNNYTTTLFTMSYTKCRPDCYDIAIVLLELGYVKKFIQFLVVDINDHRLQETLDDLADEAIICDDYQALRTILNTDWNNVTAEYFEEELITDRIFRSQMEIKEPLYNRDFYLELLESTNIHNAVNCGIELLHYKNKHTENDSKNLDISL